MQIIHTCIIYIPCVNQRMWMGLKSLSAAVSQSKFNLWTWKRFKLFSESSSGFADILSMTRRKNLIDDFISERSRLWANVVEHWDAMLCVALVEVNLMYTYLAYTYYKDTLCLLYWQYNWINVSGVITLLREHTVCEQGDVLTPEQARILVKFCS